MPVAVEPTMSLAQVKKTDLIIIPTAGMDLEESRIKNAGVIDWLRRRAPKTAIAGICTGVSLLAAAGILDGKPATTHWGVVDQVRTKYPQVDWKPDRSVTESNNVFCGGGLYASIDLSLYLVEHYCGHMVAVQTAHDSRPPRSAHDDAPIQIARSTWSPTPRSRSTSTRSPPGAA